MGKIILRLDRVMADRKMNLKELSEKVGVSNVNLSKMKTGKISAIRFSTLEAICEVLRTMKRARIFWLFLYLGIGRGHTVTTFIVILLKCPYTINTRKC